MMTLAEALALRADTQTRFASHDMQPCVGRSPVRAGQGIQRCPGVGCFVKWVPLAGRQGSNQRAAVKAPER